MRIAFELDQLIYYPRGGISVYFYCLLQQLLATQDYTCRLVYASLHQQKMAYAQKLLPGKIETRILPIPGRLAGSPLWAGVVEHFFLEHIDLFHAVAGVLPPWYRKYHPLVITVHDMVQFRDRGNNQTNIASEQYCDAIRRATNIADQIITVSEFSKRELCDILPVNPEKITAIPIASQFLPVKFAQIQPELSILAKKRYFLAVSVLSPRKNYQTLLSAWKRFYELKPDCRLMIIGRPGWYCKTIVAMIHNTPGVLHLESVNEAELLSLYQHASGYFNLSVYEGFGIPLLEAMSCATPCCYAAGSSMEEVCADTGVRVSPYDIDTVVDVMLAFYHGDMAIQKMTQRAQKRAMTFSWENTVQKTLDVYAKLK